jgi:hypothetical protein
MKYGEEGEDWEKMSKIDLHAVTRSHGLIVREGEGEISRDTKRISRAREIDEREPRIKAE